MIIHHVYASQQPHLWAFIHFYRYAAYVVFWSSIINSCLPCEDLFVEHPECKRLYLHFVTVVSFFAIDLRVDQPSVGVLPLWGGRKGRGE